MAKKSTETTTEVPKEIKGRGKYTRTNKCMKRTTEKSLESGKQNGREKYSPCNRSIESPSPQDQRLIDPQNRYQEVAPLDLHRSKEVRPSQKMRLQLFPLDSHTREGLEKNGLYPYLELKLSSRKKISSVLRHIHNKWGSSEIAQGDPILYPYDKPVLTAGYKWTTNSNITASDIYAAIGSPALFRLRYGWSSATDNKTSPSPLSISCFQHEEPPNKAVCAGFTENQMTSINTLLSSPKQMTNHPPHSENVPHDEPVQSTENKTDGVPGSTLIFWDDGLTSLSIGGLLSEASMKGSFANRFKNTNASTTLWDDGLTNMSIGSLFNDASLQGKRNTNQEQESNHSNKINIGELVSEAESDTKKAIKQQQQQPSRLISDSLDAFLISRTNQLQAQCPPPISEQPHSSILDAEDTCHAFSFRKGAITSQKVSGEAERERQRDESKDAKSLFGSVGFNMDSSLGFSGIKWGADSRGPFDLGFSSSRMFSNGDSVSLSDVIKDLQETEPLEDYQNISEKKEDYQRIRK